MGGTAGVVQKMKDDYGCSVLCYLWITEEAERLAKDPTRKQHKLGGRRAQVDARLCRPKRTAVRFSLTPEGLMTFVRYGGVIYPELASVTLFLVLRATVVFSRGSGSVVFGFSGLVCSRGPPADVR